MIDGQGMGMVMAVGKGGGGEERAASGLNALAFVSQVRCFTKWIKNKDARVNTRGYRD